ncbi:MAG: ribosome recycling factor [bacterium]|nr:ribosome recycling factor [bacterium]
MAYDFTEFRRSGESILGWLKKEYASIRTGRAMPSILDGILVDAYGSSMPINQLATISIEDSKTLRISPWDKDVAKDIDKTIRESNLGLSVALDTMGLRVSFPELTGERRAALTKIAKEKFEEARIRVRAEREKNLEALDRKEKEGSLSEDGKFRLKNELQKLVDDTNQKLEEFILKKEKEILE